MLLDYVVANVHVCFFSKQTESNIRSELTLAGITVDSQVYKTDEIIIEIIKEFFVSHNLFLIISYLLQL